MSSFISALMKQRKEAKKAEPKSNGRLKEIVSLFFAQRLFRNMKKGK